MPKGKSLPPERRRNMDKILAEIYAKIDSELSPSVLLDQVENVRTDVGDVQESISNLRQEVQKMNGLKGVVQGHHRTLYGDDGRGGIVNDITVTAEAVKTNSDSVRSVVSWIKWGLPLANVIILFILGLLVRHMAGGG